jgi:hypothetical protein
MPAVTVMMAASVARNFVSAAPSRYIYLPPTRSIGRNLGKVKSSWNLGSGAAWDSCD